MRQYFIPNFNHKNTVYLILNTPIYCIPKIPGRPCRIQTERNCQVFYFVLLRRNTQENLDEETQVRTTRKQTSLKPSRLKSASLLEFNCKVNKVIFYLPELDIVNGIKEELFVGSISENKQSYEKPPIKYLMLSRRFMELVKYFNLWMVR